MKDVLGEFHGPVMVQELFLKVLTLLLGATRVAVFQSVTSDLFAVTREAADFSGQIRIATSRSGRL